MKLSEILLLSAVVLTAGCTDQIVREYEEHTPPDIDFEDVEIDGEYEIVSDGEAEWIVYEHESERYSFIHYNSLEPAAEWIANNTDDNETVASWWDYGHDIRAQTGNEMYLVEPSEYAAERTLEGPLFGLHENYSPQEKINRMSEIFNSSSEEAASIAAEEGIEYILINKLDLYKLSTIQKASNTSSSSPIVVRGTCVSECTENSGTFSFLDQKRARVNIENETVRGDIPKCSEGYKGPICVFFAFDSVFLTEKEVADSLIVEARGESRLETVYRDDQAVILKVKN